MLPFLRVAGLREMDYLVPLVLLIAVILGAGLFGLLLGDKAAALLMRLPKSFKSVHHIFREAVSALRTYADRWLLMIGLFLLSVLMFVMLLASIALLGLAMHFDALSLPGYFAARRLGHDRQLHSAHAGGAGGSVRLPSPSLPIFWSGVPTHTSYATAFLGMRVLNTLIGVLGILPYVLQRREISRAVQRAAEADQGFSG